MASNQGLMEAHPPLCRPAWEMGLRPPKQMKNTLGPGNRSPWKRRPPLCHPEQLTCLRQVKEGMNGGCSLGEPVTFRSSRFLHPTRCFSVPKRRHPERSGSQIYHITEDFMARSRRGCPERSRGNPGHAGWQMLFGAFRPQTTREIKEFRGPFLGMFFDGAQPRACH